MERIDLSIIFCKLENGTLTRNEARRLLGLPPVVKTDRKIDRPKYTSCPNCGAPVDPYSDKCEYCDTFYF